MAWNLGNSRTRRIRRYWNHSCYRKGLIGIFFQYFINIHDKQHPIRTPIPVNQVAFFCELIAIINSRKSTCNFATLFNQIDTRSGNKFHTDVVACPRLVSTAKNRSKDVRSINKPSLVIGCKTYLRRKLIPRFTAVSLVLATALIYVSGANACTTGADNIALRWDCGRHVVLRYSWFRAAAIYSFNVLFVWRIISLLEKMSLAASTSRIVF